MLAAAGAASVGFAERDRMVDSVGLSARAVQAERASDISRR
jgi:hypothetical protein